MRNELIYLNNPQMISRSTMIPLERNAGMQDSVSPFTRLSSYDISNYRDNPIIPLIGYEHSALNQQEHNVIGYQHSALNQQEPNVKAPSSGYFCTCVIAVRGNIHKCGMI